SEHIFALFLNHLAQYNDTSNLRHYRDALKQSVDDIVELKQQYGLQAASSLNLLSTDGIRIVGSRIITESDERPLSLHYATGHRFERRDKRFTIHDDPEDDPHHEPVLTAPQKLNEPAQDCQDIPAKYNFAVDANGAATITSA